MDFRYALFVSSLMLVLVFCTAQETTVPANGTELPTEIVTTQAMDTNAADNNTTNAANNATTNASTDAPTTLAPTDAPTTKVRTMAPSTDAPMTKKPTEAPEPTTEKAPSGGATKGFSAGSFFGGMILAVAVIGIGFCGFKFYQSRQDKNYQTL